MKKEYIKIQEEKSRAFELKSYNEYKQKMVDEQLMNQFDKLSKEYEEARNKYTEEEEMTR